MGVSLNRDLCLPATAEGCTKREVPRLSTSNTFSCSSERHKTTVPGARALGEPCHSLPTPAAPAPSPAAQGTEMPPGVADAGAGCEPQPPRGATASGTHAGPKDEASETPPPPRPLLTAASPPAPRPRAARRSQGGGRGRCRPNPADPAPLPPEDRQPAARTAARFQGALAQIARYSQRALRGRLCSDVHSSILMQMGQLNDAFKSRKHAQRNKPIR